VNKTDEELESLFNRIADGLASEADIQLLGNLLRSSPELRRTYRQFMDMHSVLQWNYVAAVSKNRSSRLPSIAQARGNRRKWLWAIIGGLAAACIMIVAVLNISYLSDPSPTTAVAAKTSSAVALLLSESAAEFAMGRAPKGTEFEPGEYELLKGTVHLQFERGAEMVLNSPAKFVVKDSQHVWLEYGAIRVTVPPPAIGFTVKTSTADYIDIGTEFGLRVDANHNTNDLYVFDGQVNIAEPKSGKLWSEVKEGNSSRYVDGAESKTPEITTSDFPTPVKIGFEQWNRYRQNLLASKGVMSFYSFMRKEDESVLSNESGKDTANGRIVGAKWVSGRWPGKDALMFSHDTDFVQLEIPGEHDELTIAAWVNIDRLDFAFNAILNSDGYDPGDMHFQLNRQGYPRGGVKIDGNFTDKEFNCSVPLGKWVHVASVLSMPTRVQKMYVNGVLSRERHWPNNEILRPGLCRLGNWLPDASAKSSNRGIRGRIDELVIWDRVLSEDELLRHVKAGKATAQGNLGEK